MNYPRALKVLRGVRCITRAELAVLLGLHESYISLIESGKRAFTDEFRTAVCRRLKIPSELFDLLAADKQDLKHIEVDSAEAIGRLLLELIPE